MITTIVVTLLVALVASIVGNLIANRRWRVSSDETPITVEAIDEKLKFQRATGAKNVSVEKAIETIVDEVKLVRGRSR